MAKVIPFSFSLRECRGNVQLLFQAWKSSLAECMGYFLCAAVASLSLLCVCSLASLLPLHPLCCLCNLFLVAFFPLSCTVSLGPLFSWLVIPFLPFCDPFLRSLSAIPFFDPYLICWSSWLSRYTFLPVPVFCLCILSVYSAPLFFPRPLLPLDIEDIHSFLANVASLFLDQQWQPKVIWWWSSFIDWVFFICF